VRSYKSSYNNIQSFRPTNNRKRLHAIIIIKGQRLFHTCNGSQTCTPPPPPTQTKLFCFSLYTHARRHNYKTYFTNNLPCDSRTTDVRLNVVTSLSIRFPKEIKIKISFAMSHSLADSSESSQRTTPVP